MAGTRKRGRAAVPEPESAPRNLPPEEAESLEWLEERTRRRLGRQENDREAALEELPEELATAHRELIGPSGEGGEAGAVGPVRTDEFICSSCRLVFHRSHLGDRTKRLCRDCAASASAQPAAGRSRHEPLRFTCPACGAPLLVPERHEAPGSFTCTACGALVEHREGHLHLVWDHRVHGPPAVERDRRKAS